ncbi:MAG: DegT/DnrJ/EryC1/StrS family aminotransferase [Cyclobacteriaceae bacterium]
MKKRLSMIPVTKPFLPPINEYQNLIAGVWDRNWLTNDGPLVKQLEGQLKPYLGVEHLYTGSGTMALQLTIKALNLTGEIITTPFSYVATTSSIVWEGCTPVFVDIDPRTLNINAGLIEESITENTEAILATHIFGNPCDIGAIQVIADKYKLKVIYDGAHAFGTTLEGQSVFNFGDISITSFHATKLFHTVEGGAVFTKDREVYERLKYLRNFGHDGEEKFNGIGINGKNSEFHAAMGLVNMKYIDDILTRRKEQAAYYDELLEKVDCANQENSVFGQVNYAYYPILLKSPEILVKIREALVSINIYTRRYFYPGLNMLDYVGYKPMPIAEDISSRILCLPLYHELEENEQRTIVKTIIDSLIKKYHSTPKVKL